MDLFYYEFFVVLKEENLEKLVEGFLFFWICSFGNFGVEIIYFLYFNIRFVIFLF